MTPASTLDRLGNDLAATDLVTILDLAKRYKKSERHVRRIIMKDGFPKPFRIGLTGRTNYWHFGDIVEWERKQSDQNEAA